MVNKIIFNHFIMKKLSGVFKGMELWVISLLGAVIVVILIYFGSGSAAITILYENNKESLLISVFVIFFIVFIIYSIISIKDYFFRSYQIKEIANKYNLNYTNPKKPFFELSLPDTRKSNVIEGKINGKNILIYDFTNFQAYDLGLGSVSSKATIISVDGKEKELRGFFTGFCSIKKIDSFLADLSKGK